MMLVVVEVELDDVNGLLLMKGDGDTVDDEHDKDALVPAEG